MSPTRRDILKAAGAIPAAFAFPALPVVAIDPPLTADAFAVEFCCVGARRGDVTYSLLKGGHRPPELHSYVRHGDKVYTLENPLSPKAQHIFDGCLAQMATLLAIEENEDGWE